MNLNDWALTWGIPAIALADLRRRMLAETDVPYTPPTGIAPHTEAFSQSQIRLEMAQRGISAWRNNSGACYDENGNFIRYGLANDSEQVNKILKSSDLIGVDSRPIPPEAVGRPWGRFIARECKAPGWVFTGTERELAQRAFGNLIMARGGDFAFATGPGTL